MLLPRLDGENVKERVYVFLNRHLNISLKYSTTHEGEIHRVTLTISGNLYYKTIPSNILILIFFWFAGIGDLSGMRSTINRTHNVCNSTSEEACTSGIHVRGRNVSFLKYIRYLHYYKYPFLFLCRLGPRYLFAKFALDWERGNCLGGWDYGNSKSRIVQLLTEKNIRMSTCATSWRRVNRTIFRCSLDIPDGM
jgi:hypothetical protein